METEDENSVKDSTPWKLVLNEDEDIDDDRGGVQASPQLDDEDEPKGKFKFVWSGVTLL